MNPLIVTLGALLGTHYQRVMAKKPARGNEEAERFLGLLSDDERASLARLKQVKEFFTLDHVLRQHDRANWGGARPEIEIFAARLYTRCRKMGIPLYAHGVVRTQVQQDKLRAMGRSKASWPIAPHCQGAAVDLVHSRYHWDMTRVEWAIIGKIGKQVARDLGLKVIWGGDWDFYDPAHWELKGWRDDIRRDTPPVRRATLAHLAKKWRGVAKVSDLSQPGA